MSGVGVTHTHPSWRNFATVPLQPMPPDRYEITFTDVPDPLPDRPQPDRYTITVTWREAGSNNDATYILVIEV